MADGNPYELLNRLVKNICTYSDLGYNAELVSKFYELSLIIVGSEYTLPYWLDEYSLVENMKLKLKSNELLVSNFDKCIKNLRSSDILSNKFSIIYFLSLMSNNRAINKEKNIIFNMKSMNVMDKDFSTYLTKSSKETENQKILFDKRNKQQNSDDITSNQYNKVLKQTNSNYGSQIPLNNSERINYLLKVKEEQLLPPPNASLLLGDSVKSSAYDVGTGSTEIDLLRDLIYVLQGVDGKYISYDKSLDSFCLSSKSSLPNPTKDLIQKICELGWLYRKIKRATNQRHNDKNIGMVGQGFILFVKQHLNDYNKYITILDSEILQRLSSIKNKNDNDFKNMTSVVHQSSHDSGWLTLRKLYCSSFDSFVSLKYLCAMIESSKNKKGGNLLSVLYSYTLIGDPFLKKIAMDILRVTYVPIRKTIEAWIFNGELLDPYSEFFVTCNNSVKPDNFWNDKYSLKVQSIPSFMPVEIANKILNAGKALNFIRFICGDDTDIMLLKKLEESSKMDNQSKSDSIDMRELSKVVNEVHLITSKHLLNLMLIRFKLITHLNALRRYLMLGQGDFIQQLITLLEPELKKSCSKLYTHNMTNILENAVRATNAQFDDPDILKRLDCRFLESYTGDSGWDVFTLEYKITGPISTIFTREIMVNYLKVFNFLWKVKKMEHSLVNVWKQQAIFHRTSNKISVHELEIKNVLHVSNAIQSEMIHFINQIQYYIMFEVECLYEELIKDINNSTDLDTVINSHQHFIRKVITRCLLDNENKNLAKQFRTIFESIAQFKKLKLSLIQSDCLFEDETVNKIIKEDNSSTISKKINLTIDFINATKNELVKVNLSFQSSLRQFMMLLASSTDFTLKSLCLRLDFNEYYRQQEPSLLNALRKSFCLPSNYFVSSAFN